MPSFMDICEISVGKEKAKILVGVEIFHIFVGVKT